MTTTLTPTAPAIAATIAELHNLMRVADGALTDRYTLNGEYIHEVDRDDDRSYVIWTSRGVRPISGAEQVIPAFSAPTHVTCPLGCGRQVAAEGDEIHYCVTTIRFGRKKAATNREYVGTWNGEALFFGACHDEVERKLRPYREEQLASAVGTSDDDPFNDGPSQEEQAASAAAWIPCEGGWEQQFQSPMGIAGLSDFDPGRTVRLFQPRLFSAEPEPGPLVDDGPEDNAGGFRCNACYTSDYGPSSLQPFVCYQCLDAWLLGYTSRLDPRYATRGSPTTYSSDRPATPIEPPPPPAPTELLALGVCPNCGGAHHIQYCPKVVARLKQPEPCGCNPTRLVAAIIPALHLESSSTDAAYRRAQILSDEAEALENLLYTALGRLSAGKQSKLYARVKRIWGQACRRANERQLAQSVAFYRQLDSTPAPDHPRYDAIMTALAQPPAERRNHDSIQEEPTMLLNHEPDDGDDVTWNSESDDEE
jgi:hypothetical protein